MRGVKDVSDLWGHVSNLSTGWLQPELRRLGLLAEPKRKHDSLLDMLLGLGGELRGIWPAEDAPENPWLFATEHSLLIRGDSLVG